MYPHAFRVVVLCYAASIWTEGSAEEWIVDSNASFVDSLQRLSNGDTVTLLGGNYSRESCNLTVRVSNVTIRALYPNSVTINCNLIARHLYIVGSNVVLQGISFINGFSHVSGGCVLVIQSGCVIRDCTFNSCSTSASGGAVMFERTATNSSIIDSEFIQCSASLGGAIYLDSGSHLKIFSGQNIQEDVANRNDGYAGGEERGITVVNLAGKFVRNSSKTFGGAIYVDEEAELIISGPLQFTNNTAILNGSSSAGGALYAVGSLIRFSVYSNITFEGNVCAGAGGAMALFNGCVWQSEGSVSLKGQSVPAKGS